MVARPHRLVPATTTDEFLAELLGEVRAIRQLLAQEPAPVTPTGPGLRLVTEPVPAPEPPPMPAGGGLPVEPPRVGRGASRRAWADYATRLGVPYPKDATRSQIVAAVDE